MPTIPRKAEVDLSGKGDGAGWIGSVNDVGGCTSILSMSMLDTAYRSGPVPGGEATAGLSSAGTSGKTPNARPKIVSTALTMVVQIPGITPTRLKIVIVEATSARMRIATMMRRLFRRFLLSRIIKDCCACLCASILHAPFAPSSRRAGAHTLCWPSHRRAVPLGSGD